MELSLPATAAQSAGAPALRDAASRTPQPGDAPPAGDEAIRDPLGSGRRTLALRLAQRGRLRELRAERLARLRSGSAPDARPQAAAQPVVSQPVVSQPVATQPVAPQAAPVAPLAPAVEAIRPPVPLTPRKAAEEDAVAALEEFLRALTGGLGEAAPADWGLPAAAAPGPAAVLPFQRRDLEPAPENRPEAETVAVAAPAADPAPLPEAMPAARPVAAAAQEAAPAQAPARTAPEMAAETTAAPTVETAPGIAPETAVAIAATPDGALALAEEASSPADPAPAAGLAQLPGAGPGLLWALDRAGITDIADLAGLAPEALAERLGPIGRLIPAARWIEAARGPVADDRLPAG